MELRKIQSTAGGATYIVSLPRAWIKRNNIAPGEKVGIIERSDEIMFIIPKPHKKEKNVAVIDASRKDMNFILRMIISEYIRGAEIIRFEHDAFSWKDKKEIREFIQNAMIGIDLNEHGDNFEIQSIIDVYELDIEEIVMRVYDLVGWMFKNSFTAIENRDADLFIDIIGRDIEVDRLTLLVSRQMHLASKNPAFAKKTGVFAYDALHYNRIIGDLESAGDCSVGISEAYLKLVDSEIPNDLVKSLKGLFDELAQNLEKVIESFNYENLDMANEVVEDCMRLSKYDLSASGKSLFITDKRITHDSIIVGAFAIVLENLARINGIARSIAETVMDRGRTKK